MLNIKHLISKQQWNKYVAYKHIYLDGDIVVGTLTCNEYDDSDAVIINGVYVNENYRNKGIGTMMMKDITNNDLPMCLEVDMDNQVAIKLYEKFGFHYWQESDTSNMYWMKNFKYTKIYERDNI